MLRIAGRSSWAENSRGKAERPFRARRTHQPRSILASNHAHPGAFDLNIRSRSPKHVVVAKSEGVYPFRAHALRLLMLAKETE